MVVICVLGGVVPLHVNGTRGEVLQAAQLTQFENIREADTQRFARSGNRAST